MTLTPRARFGFTLFCMTISLALLSACEPLGRPASPTSRAEGAGPQPPSAQSERDVIEPEWKVGDRVEESALERARDVATIKAPTHIWTLAKRLRVVGASPTKEGVMRIFFDRPVEKASVVIECDTAHRADWLGDQLLVIYPLPEVPAGTLEVRVTAATAEDKTTLATPWSERFERVLDEGVVEEARSESVAPEEEAKAAGEKKRIIYIDPGLPRYVRGARPKFKFYSNEKLDPKALEEAVVFAQRKTVFGTRTLIPVRAKTRYLGTRKGRSDKIGRVHTYEAVPAHDLEVGNGSYFHVNTEMRAPGYRLSEYHWTTHYFGVLERDLSFSFSVDETAMYATATHPIAPAQLETCFSISPKPRVYDVSLVGRSRLHSKRRGSWTYLLDVLPAMPGMTYKVKVRPSCRSELGTTPHRAFSHTYKLTDNVEHYVGDDGAVRPDWAPKSLWAPRRSKPMLVEASQLASAPYFPVTTRNYDQDNVRVARLTQREILSSMDGGVSPGDVEVIALEQSDDPLEFKRQEVDLSSSLGDEHYGAVCLLYGHSSKRCGEDRSVVLVSTDMALTRRGTLFWVTRLSSAAPVEGAVVTAWKSTGEAVASGKTDADGLVSLSVERASMLDKAVFTAEFENDITLLEPGEDASSRMRHGKTWQWRAHAVTDRGMYRPGDRVHLSGWLRKQVGGESKIPELDDEVSLMLRAPSGEEKYCSSSLSAFGGWGCEVSIPQDAKHGKYRVFLRFNEGGAERAAVSLELDVPLSVTRYEPPRFALEARRSVDRRKLEVEVLRYAGAAIPDAPLTYAISAQPIAWNPEGYEGFSFGGAGDEVSLVQGDGVSDRKGRASFKIPTSKITAPTRFRAEVTAEDIDGEVIARKLSWTALPKRIVGLRVGDGASWFSHERSDEIVAQVVALDEEGEPGSSGALNVELHRVVYHSTYKLGADGSWNRHGSQERERVARCSTRPTKAKIGHCRFRPKEGGQYVVEVRSGSRVLVERSIYVASGRHVDPRPGGIELLARWPQYPRGGVAEILLNSPYTREARALVTMEGAGDDAHPVKVLWQDVIPVTKSSTPIEIPIPEGLAPQDVTVTAVVVRGRVSLPSGHPASWTPHDRKANLFWDAKMHWKGRVTTKKIWDEGFDPGRPMARSASTRFRVTSSAEGEATLTVTPASTTARPDDEVQLALSLRGGDGKPYAGEAVVMVVDEGALAVSGHGLSRPAFEVALARYLSSAVFDSRSILTTPDEIGMKSNPGGGGLRPGVGKDTFRMEGVLTAHVEKITLGEDGDGEVRFVAPERLSDYRVMAIATHGASADDFAIARSSLTVSKAIQVRPSLPRYITQGDVFTVRAMILTERDGPVRVALGASGGVELIDPDTAEVSVVAKRGEPQWARWKVRASGAALDAAFRFEAVGEKALEGESDRVKAAIPARPTRVNKDQVHDPWQNALLDEPLWSAERSGVLRAGSIRAKIDVDGMKIDEHSRVTITTSSSSYHLLEPMLTGLVAYPHGCGEQTSSKLHGVLVALEFARTREEWKGRIPELEAKAGAGIARLIGMQRSDGSLPLWPGEASHHWVTLYGTWTLLHASRLGKGKDALVVPQQSLERLLDSIAARMNQGRYVNLQDRAFASWVLAMAGRMDRGRVDVIYGQRDELTRVTAALLAMTYAELGISTRAREVLAWALEPERTLSEHKTFYSSDRRELATVLLAATRIKPEATVLSKLFGEVVRARGDSTQARAFSTLAIFEAGSVLGGERSIVSVVLGGEVIAQKEVGEDTWSVVIPLERFVKADVEDMHLMSSSLLAGVRYRIELETPLEVDDATRWEELQLARVLVHASGPKRGEEVRTPLSVGDLVLVHHVLGCGASSSQLAVMDPLPSGLERVQAEMETTASRELALAGAPSKLHPALAPWREHGARIHQEGLEVAEGLYPRSCSGVTSTSYLARATTPGTFVSPAVYAEYMYRRELNAKSEPGAAVVIVE